MATKQEYLNAFLKAYMQLKKIYSKNPEFKEDATEEDKQLFNKAEELCKKIADKESEKIKKDIENTIVFLKKIGLTDNVLSDADATLSSIGKIISFIEKKQTNNEKDARLNFVIVPNQEANTSIAMPEHGKKKNSGGFNIDAFWFKISLPKTKIIKATDTQDAISQIINHLERESAQIGTLTIDSHGERDGSFSIGESTYFPPIEGIEYSVGVDISKELLFKKLSTEPENSEKKYIDKESKVVLSACWAGNNKELLQQLHEALNGATIYANKTFSMSIGLFFRRSFTAWPWANDKLSLRTNAKESDLENTGKWTKISRDEEGMNIEDLETFVKYDNRGNAVESKKTFLESKARQKKLEKFKEVIEKRREDND